MVYASDLRQALEAGVWKRLGQRSRAALHVACQAARDFADAMQEEAVLKVSQLQKHGSATAMAAFHAKLLSLRTLHVWYACTDLQAGVCFCLAYAATAGEQLAATSCCISVLGRAQLPKTALLYLLGALPRLERLTIRGTFIPPTGLVATSSASSQHLCVSIGQVAQALRHRPYIQHLALETNGGAEQALLSLTNEDLAHICQLPQLCSLRGPWQLSMHTVQQLCDNLPHLECLGFRWLSYGGARGSSTPTVPNLRMLTGPLQYEPTSAWSPALWTGRMFVSDLAAFPDLQCMQGIELHSSLGPDCCQPELCTMHSTSATPSIMNVNAVGRNQEVNTLLHAVQSVKGSLATCCWQVHVMEDMAEMLQQLPVQGLDTVCSLQLTWEPQTHTTFATALSSILPAAPNLQSLCLDFPYRSAAALATALLPLRQAGRLHTLWLNRERWLRGDAQAQVQLLQVLMQALLQAQPEASEPPGETAADSRLEPLLGEVAAASSFVPPSGHGSCTCCSTSTNDDSKHGTNSWGTSRGCAAGSDGGSAGSGDDGGRRTGCKALRSVLLQDADAASVACVNVFLAAQGYAARAGTW